ncbi:unnamed protein product [Boreogadus saida]
MNTCLMALRPGSTLQRSTRWSRYVKLQRGWCPLGSWMEGEGGGNPVEHATTMEEQGGGVGGPARWGSGGGQGPTPLGAHWGPALQGVRSPQSTV